MDIRNTNTSTKGGTYDCEGFGWLYENGLKNLAVLDRTGDSLSSIIQYLLYF